MTTLRNNEDHLSFSAKKALDQFTDDVYCVQNCQAALMYVIIELIRLQRDDSLSKEKLASVLDLCWLLEMCQEYQQLRDLIE